MKRPAGLQRVEDCVFAARCRQFDFFFAGFNRFRFPGPPPFFKLLAFALTGNESTDQLTTEPAAKNQEVNDRHNFHETIKQFFRPHGRPLCYAPVVSVNKGRKLI